jgi:hypothetical protein
LRIKRITSITQKQGKRKLSRWKGLELEQTAARYVINLSGKWCKLAFIYVHMLWCPVCWSSSTLKIQKVETAHSPQNPATFRLWAALIAWINRTTSILTENLSLMGATRFQIYTNLEPHFLFISPKQTYFICTACKNTSLWW